VRQFTETTGSEVRVQAFVYDLSRRLTLEAEFSHGGSIMQSMMEYSFDARGNRSRMIVTGVMGVIDHTVTYTYDLNNRLLTEVRTGTGASTTTYTYDRNGNQLTRVTGGVTESSTYNAWNQLTRVVSGTMTADYVYRSDGLRLSKTVNGVRTTHIWDGAHMVAELNAARTVTNRFFRGLGMELVRSVNHGVYVYNARGDVVHLVSSGNNGALLYSYRYSAFGVQLNPAGTDRNPWRFAGEYFDRETGRYYLRARFFDPRVGRFTQPDPHWNTGNMIWGDDTFEMGHGVMMPCILSIIQSGNLFVYCLNNPIMFVDPSGLSVKDSLLSDGGGGSKGGIRVHRVRVTNTRTVKTTPSNTPNLTKNNTAQNITPRTQSTAHVVRTQQAERSILSNSTFTNTTSTGVSNYQSNTKGKAAARADFDSLRPTNVRTYTTATGTTTVGDLPDGRTVNIHAGHSVGLAPTLEIYDRNTNTRTKIRY